MYFTLLQQGRPGLPGRPGDPGIEGDPVRTEFLVEILHYWCIWCACRGHLVHVDSLVSQAIVVLLEGLVPWADRERED